MPVQRVSPEDALLLGEVLFEWADSYDHKDWDRLRKILYPDMMIDYSMKGSGMTAMPCEEFVAMISAPKMLGNALMHTQHLIGASKYTFISSSEVRGVHQIRASHLEHESDGTTVKGTANGSAVLHFTYRKYQDEWKLSGIQPILIWEEKTGRKLFA